MKKERIKERGHVRRKKKESREKKIKKVKGKEKVERNGHDSPTINCSYNESRLLERRKADFISTEQWGPGTSEVGIQV